MEVLIGIAAAAIFGFVGYKLYQSRTSTPTTSGGGRTQSSNPSRDVETRTENKVGAKSSSQPPKRKSNSTRSAKPRKSTPRKNTGGNKKSNSRSTKKGGGSGSQKRQSNTQVKKSK
jgi:hypothetical protein